MSKPEKVSGKELKRRARQLEKYFGGKKLMVDGLPTREFFTGCRDACSKAIHGGDCPVYALLLDGEKE